MNGAIKLFRFLALGLTVVALPVLADDTADAPAALDQPAAEVVFVSAQALDPQVVAQDEFDDKVSHMIEDELMLNLLARLTTAAPAT